MTRWVWVMCAVAVLFVSTEAHAQFNNRSVGAQVGFIDLDRVGGVVDWGIPLGINSTGYIDAGFEWTFGISGMLLGIEGSDSVVLGATGGPGMRYLFLQETLRPYAGVELTYLHIFFGNLGVDLTANYVGLAPNVGIDYFVMDTLSLGAKAQFNVYVTLTNRLEFQTSKAFFLTGSAWF